MSTSNLSLVPNPGTEYVEPCVVPVQDKITFTLYTSTDHLSKRYWTDKGLIQKQAAAQMYKGTAERVTMSFAEFPTALSKATEKQAFGYGLYPLNYLDKVNIVVAGKEQAEKNSISRTQKFYAYTEGPGGGMFDHDPNPYGPVMSSVQLIQALIEIHPEIARAARVVRGSVSAGIHKTGEIPRTDKGFHVYILVKNAADIPRYGKVVFDRLWLNGFGFIALASNGALLVRTVIDGAVFSPERLDFVGKPIIEGEGLEYTPPEIIYTEGDLLDTESLPDLTDDEQAAVKQLIADAKEAIKPAAVKKEKQWAGEKIEAMRAKGTSVKKAMEVVNRILKGGCQDLYDDFILEFTTGPVSVADVMKNPTAFDGKALADPIEGVEYGRTTAMLYWNDGKPVIHSLAHGQNSKYFLHKDPENDAKVTDYQAPTIDFSTEPDYGESESAAPIKPPASTFNDTLDTEHKYCTVDLLRHVADDHLLKQLSIQITAETHIPVNTVFLMGIAIFSSMAARKYSVLYPNDEQLPIGLYAVAEQPSGSAKSRCLRSFERPFRTIQKRLKNKLATEKKQFDKRDSEKFTDQESEDYKALIKKMRRLSMGLFITNATSEGLETTLAHSQGYFSAISSEQGLFNTLFGNCYKPEGSSNNNDVVLNGFDGGTINSIRAKREGYSGDVVGGIACFAQPGSTEIILKASNGTGLSERFVMLSEPHNLGKRDHTKEVNQDDTLLADYQKCCELLESVINEPLEFEKLNNLTISKDCFFKINEYRNRIESHLADGGKFSHVSLRGAASKIDMQIMKIAANLHLFDYDFYNVIHERHVTAAIDIADELLEAKLKLCIDKGILGMKAEFTAILSLFENNPKSRTERNIIQAKLRQKPFSEHTGNISDLIRKNLADMVDQKLLRKQYVPDSAVLYSPRQ